MNAVGPPMFRRRKTLPVLIAAEAAECGLACMAMIGQFFGHDIDLNGLRQRFPVSMSGTNLRSLTALADLMGFSSRALRVELSAVDQIVLPAVIHWDLNHFVVLQAVKRDSFVVHDPARGRLTLPRDEFSKHFTGVVLEVQPAPPFEPIVARASVGLRSLWSSMRGATTSFSVVIALSIALQIVAFALPFQMQFVVDDVIGNNDVDLLAVVAIGFGMLIVVQALIQAMRDWMLQLLGSQMVFQMVGNLVRHLVRLPSGFFEKRHVGDIISRIGSSRQIQDALTNGIISALLDGAVALVAAVILVIYAPLLAAVVIASVLLVLALHFAFYPVIRARTEETIATGALEQTHLMETVRAATTIKLLGREAERESSWRNLYGRNFNAAVSLGRFQISLTLLQNVLIGLQSVIVIYLGAKSILTAQGFSVGMLMAFLSLRQTFTDRAISLVTRGFQLRSLSLHLERLGDIIGSEIEEGRDQVAPMTFSGAISLRGVSFKYGTSDPWIFRDLNIEIQAGECVALLGPSGSGKSTFLKLLLGLQRPMEGEVFLDGHPSRPALHRLWREQVGIVSQDDRLLSGTLADNIAFFDPNLDLTRVHMAAMAAQIHREIMAMPMNYLTLVGDMGSSLSAGQKQRVLLARAFYRQPKILVLDEGTANLDPENEESILHLISQLSMTRIIIAHRSALIRAASRVLQVEGGKIVMADVQAQSRSMSSPLGERVA